MIGTVVKLGGSFARDPRLPAIVAALEEGAGTTVVVPGGGPFADCVRAEQGRIGFGDAAAHRMALLAMAQFGTALASLSPMLQNASSLPQIRGAAGSGRVPVWLPLDILDGHLDIPESWQMTSDSLAAWLAGSLGASRLIFVKQAAPTSAGLDALVEAEFLDPLVPRFLRGTSIEAWLCGPRDLPRLGQALAAGEGVGTRIELRQAALKSA